MLLRNHSSFCAQESFLEELWGLYGVLKIKATLATYKASTLLSLFFLGGGGGMHLAVLMAYSPGPIYAQGSLLAFIMGPYGILGNGPGLTTCRANTLAVVL